MWRLFLALLTLARVAVAQDLTGPTGYESVSTLTVVTAGKILFLTSSAGVSSSEAEVAMPIATRMTFRNMACTTSAATGTGQNVVVSGRVGSCGGLSDVSAFTCAIPGNNSAPGVCTTGTASLAVQSQQCWSLKISTPSGMLAPVFVKCSFERAA